MTITALMLFAATELIVSLSPGPAVFLVVSQGMRFGARASLRGALGIIIGDLIYFVVSALGLGAILLASHNLFMFVKWAGALYLVLLGAKTILATWKATGQSVDNETVASHSRLFRQGLLIQLANPKAILFFTALVPQFVDPESAPAPQFFALGLVSISIHTPVLLFYGWLAEKGGQWFRRSRYARWIDRVAGVFMIGAGVKLGLSR